jgi:hypothetical protein
MSLLNPLQHPSRSPSDVPAYWGVFHGSGLVIGAVIVAVHYLFF